MVRQSGHHVGKEGVGLTPAGRQTSTLPAHGQPATLRNQSIGWAPMLASQCVYMQPHAQGRKICAAFQQLGRCWQDPWARSAAGQAAPSTQHTTSCHTRALSPAPVAAPPHLTLRQLHTLYAAAARNIQQGQPQPGALGNLIVAHTDRHVTRGVAVDLQQ